jgi:hypothetical protein
MANFDLSTAKREAVRNANNLLPLIQGGYTSAKLISEALALYQSGTNPTFNAAVNALYAVGERTELAQIGQLFDTLIGALEASHAGALGAS